VTERLSPLAGLDAAPGSGAVTLSLLAAGTILRIQAWPDTLDAVREALAEACGVSAPPIGEARAGGDATLIGIGLGAFLVLSISYATLGRLRGALPADQAALTDVSHGRSLLKLEGDAAEPVLQKCVTIDLSRLSPGHAAQTMIDHVDVLIHRVADTDFRLLTFRSFARSLAEWLLDQGLEEGIGFRP
jgi:sarcosine oxidase subunit gamma